jgi:hypothetical protein
MKIIDWFINCQAKIAGILGAICSAIVLLIDFRGVSVLILSIFCFGMIFAASRLYEADTSENWLDSSWRGLFRKVIGGVLMLLGWMFLLRGVISRTIAAILLKLG